MLKCLEQFEENALIVRCDTENDLDIFYNVIEEYTGMDIEKPGRLIPGTRGVFFYREGGDYEDISFFLGEDSVIDNGFENAKIISARGFRQEVEEYVAKHCPLGAIVTVDGSEGIWKIESHMLEDNTLYLSLVSFPVKEGESEHFKDIGKVARVSNITLFE